MNKKLIQWSITVALGGLIFGMDVAVISGAEQSIQKLWSLTNLQHGLAIAIALYGTVLGAAFGAKPADSFGRKPTLIVIGIIFLLSALGSAVANSVETFMIWRFLGGISIGASSVVAPVYIAEIAPAAHRGKMVVAFQLNIVFGILLAYFTNYYLAKVGLDWRYMLGIVAVPSAFFSILMCFTPESPRWLVLHKNNISKATQILSQVDSNAVNSILAIQNAAKNNTASGAVFWSKINKTPIILAFLLAFFNQASGINAIIYFAPRVLELTGAGADSALVSTVGIGIVNLIFTILGWFLIDRFGRRMLMYIGSFGYILSLLLVSYSFASNQLDFVVYYIFLFIASHAIGQGAVIWVFISEIFPSQVRASGMAFGSLVHWVFAALLANFFPKMVDSYGPDYIFGFFAIMMVFQLLFVRFLMPETKGHSLEKINIISH